MLIPILNIIVMIFFQDECYEALESISHKINTNDADMRSHVVLSMIKVSAALADVPPAPARAAPTLLFVRINARHNQIVMIITTLMVKVVVGHMWS